MKKVSAASAVGMVMIAACGGGSAPPAPPPSGPVIAASSAPVAARPAPTAAPRVVATDPARLHEASTLLRACNLRVATRGKILANQKALRATIKGDLIIPDDKVIGNQKGPGPLVPDSFADVAVLLAEHPEIQLLEISAHVEKAAGTDPRAVDVSSQWGREIEQYLRHEGHVYTKLRTVGFGSHCPLDTATTPEAAAKNRRIELRKDVFFTDLPTALLDTFPADLEEVSRRRDPNRSAPATTLTYVC